MSIYLKLAALFPNQTYYTDLWGPLMIYPIDDLK